MKKLYTQQEFDLAKSTDKLKLECYHCKGIFSSKKSLIKLALNIHTDKEGVNRSTSCRFCSRKCFYENHKEGTTVSCKECKKEFYKTKAELKRYPNNFCSNSCSAKNMNKNKCHGTRRSKLEIWIEEQLTNLYPNLQIEFNKTNAIGSELDVFIPSINIAFELNGIFHYEPIFGPDKLQKIKNNDSNKFLKCIEHKIDLCIIDTSQQTYVKPKTSQKYLDIITNIINERI
jgi:hypothetical protein